MYTRRTKIIAFACITRFATIILQFITNLLIPDHNADAFRFPKDNLTNSFLDESVTVLLGGFMRWDAQYFMHIAKYGYTYENTLAFFPLYPLIVKAIATLITYFTVYLNEDSILLLTFIVLNMYVFLKAVIALYELSLCIVSKDLAYKSAILFCINPATIFFVAPYTECLFSYLTFKAMLNCMLIYDKHSVKSKSDVGLNFKCIINGVLPLGLSTCVRSNGIINIGFIVYFITKLFVDSFILQKTVKRKILHVIKFTVLLMFIVCISLIPFVLVQMYDYYKFCTSFSHDIPDFLVDFAKNNDLVLPGTIMKHKQTWCFKNIPLAYSYIQEHYWNVGFLKYFEIKQIPNFILAFPIVFLIITNSIKFFMLNIEYSLNLGVFKFKFPCLQHAVKAKAIRLFEQKMFVFIAHAFILTLICVLCIHVQVTTRMICSASPVLYWFAANYFKGEIEQNTLFGNNFLLSKNKNKQERWVLYYFISYFFLGIALFCNFLPWT